MQQIMVYISTALDNAHQAMAITVGWIDPNTQKQAKEAKSACGTLSLYSYRALVLIKRPTYL